jgi:hypothetical protein
MGEIKSDNFLHQLYICERRTMMNKPFDTEGKSEVIENLLEDFSKLIGTPRSVAFKMNTCVTCGGEAKEFRDTPSKKEYTISGMCQGCQDKIWG